MSACTHRAQQEKHTCIPRGDLALPTGGQMAEPSIASFATITSTFTLLAEYHGRRLCLPLVVSHVDPSRDFLEATTPEGGSPTSILASTKGETRLPETINIQGNNCVHQREPQLQNGDCTLTSDRQIQAVSIDRFTTKSTHLHVKALSLLDERGGHR